MRSINLVVTFFLELAAFAAFAFWGAEAFNGGLAVVAAFLAPAIAVVLWAVFGAPKSARRLRPLRLLAFRLIIDGLAVVALAAAGSASAALLLGAVVIVNTLLSIQLGQWNE